MRSAVHQSSLVRRKKRIRHAPPAASNPPTLSCRFSSQSAAIPLRASSSPSTLHGSLPPSPRLLPPPPIRTCQPPWVAATPRRSLRARPPARPHRPAPPPRPPRLARATTRRGSAAQHRIICRFSCMPLTGLSAFLAARQRG